METKLGKQFTFVSLLKFAIPNVIMMITLSMYMIVDGMFISRFLGTTALSSANMIYPAICVEMAIAIMVATGGSAIIARELGEGKQKDAREHLSFLIVVEILIGLLIAIVGNVWIEEIVALLGASEVQFQDCVEYAQILFTFTPMFFLQTAFQTFLVTAGKPTLGLVVTLLAGVSNILLDYIFMGPFQMGIAGAAFATIIGYCIPAIIGLAYFFMAKDAPLHFIKLKVDWHILLHTCSNGSSEMVTNLANAATTFLFNFMFLRYYGEDGVASITIVLYFQYIFTALYFGYSNGIAPIISYKYGSNDRKQLQDIFKSSMLFLLVSTFIGNGVMHLWKTQAFLIFTTMDSPVYEITNQGFTFYSLAFLVMGFGIFASALFTALSDGKTSAIISISRTFIFILGSIFLLPYIFHEVGLWLAVPVAECLGLFVAFLYEMNKRNTYGYLK